MKKKNYNLELKKFLKTLSDIQILSIYCLLYEELSKRGLVERHWFL